MTTDKQRIEDCIIPALLEGIIHHHLKEDSKAIESYKDALAIIHHKINGHMRDSTNPRKLFKRLDRICNIMSRYMIQEKFCTRKAFLTISGWNIALLRGGAFYIEDKEYCGLLKDLRRVIRRGYIVFGVNEFRKIEKSAINHVQAFHKLAEDNGYFI